MRSKCALSTTLRYWLTVQKCNYETRICHIFSDEDLWRKWLEKLAQKRKQTLKKEVGLCNNPENQTWQQWQKSRTRVGPLKSFHNENALPVLVSKFPGSINAFFAKKNKSKSSPNSGARIAFRVSECLLFSTYFCPK